MWHNNYSSNSNSNNCNTNTTFPYPVYPSLFSLFSLSAQPLPFSLFWTLETALNNSDNDNNSTGLFPAAPSLFSEGLAFWLIDAEKKRDPKKGRGKHTVSGCLLCKLSERPISIRVSSLPSRSFSSTPLLTEHSGTHDSLHLLTVLGAY